MLSCDKGARPQSKTLKLDEYGDDIVESNMVKGENTLLGARDRHSLAQMLTISQRMYCERLYVFVQWLYHVIIFTAYGVTTL